MTQIVINKTVYRTATMFLKKSDAGSDKKNVAESINAFESAKNKIAMLHDNYMQVFTENHESKKYPTSANEDWYAGNIICDQFVGDHNATMDSSTVYGMPMRKFKAGDLVQIQEWTWEEEIMEVRGYVNRFFIVGENDFDEFNIVTGEFL